MPSESLEVAMSKKISTQKKSDSRDIKIQKLEEENFKLRTQNVNLRKQKLKLEEENIKIKEQLSKFKNQPKIDYVSLLEEYNKPEKK